MSDLNPDRDPLADEPGPAPADDGLPADAPEHDAEDPAPPDEGEADAEAHPIEGEGAASW